MGRKQIDMCNGPLLGKIISFTIPVILTGVLQLFFNAADLVVVGLFCGSNSVGAVGVTTSIINLIVNLFIGLSVGAGVAVSQGIGAKNDDYVHKTVHTVIPIAVIGGLVLTVVGVTFSGTFLDWMDTPADIHGLATSYMQVYFGGIISSMLYNYGAAILRAAGDTRTPLVYLSLSGIINVVLNYIFVISTPLDVAGVALATVLSQTFAATMILRALVKRTDACHLDFKKLRIYKAPFLNVLKIGVPAGLHGALFSISNVIIQSSVNGFGSNALISGNSASHSIESFVYISMNSFHQTALNFTGQNYGAGQYRRLKKVMGICLSCVAVVGLCLGLLSIVLAEPLLSLYINDSAEAIKWGVLRMTVINGTYFLCGLMDVTTGGIRGMGNSLSTMIISVVGVCGIRLGWIYTIFTIPQYHTPQSLYMAYPISWFVTFVVQLILFIWMVNRCIKREKTEE